MIMNEEKSWIEGKLFEFVSLLLIFLVNSLSG